MISCAGNIDGDIWELAFKWNDWIWIYSSC